jgi:hypothetical protein
MKMLLLLPFVGGCGLQPVLSYQHQSDPRISNDGYDLACAGLEVGDRWRIRGDICENFAPADTTPVRISVEYRP